ncbi:zf-HC2 domain-containing protein [Thermosynechococcaceae cyanobacterium BACA0444]|uniref:Zf-HC2 domain-containing protein n=1 Tax=Pseudocalidococcus azoricus BACA0444 TaxID=2918990 RepID=A0AAE4FS29_9CYAN|nr:zf-HC2 domain-containing protein [Pseudocalidococcus azoricus]MDS3861091.1 zf-HC2 domain-containing protein [Pseudocalidococcus azoricus BACA0444]
MDSPNPFSPKSTPPNSPDSSQAERFELLSAYVDGEVTPAQRAQVEAWLATEPDYQHLYHRLLKLQQSLHQAPCPLTTSAETLANQVLAKAQNRPRTLLAWTGVGAVSAAALVGVLSSVFPGLLSPIPLNETAAADLTPTAIRTTPSGNLYEPQNNLDLENTANLMLTLDRPPVAIPVSTRTEPGLDRRTLNLNPSPQP